MLNEYVYCPRLFYLEYVQREWATNLDVLQGRYVHRRVDQAAGRVPRAEAVTAEVAIHARSVEIGSEELGAVAVIDVLESDDGQLVPVDYKKGSAPDLPEGAWEPERIQVCLQGLLLRANGYVSNYGVIYYVGDKTRVRVEFTPALVTRTKQLLADARALAVAGSLPPPLVNSNKCPRCSLVGICLPDELNHVQQVTGSRPTAETAHGSDKAGSVAPDVAPARREIRRLFPARDDNKAVYVQGQGYTLGLRGATLEIRDKGQAVDAVRLFEVSQLNIFGNVQLSAQALRALASQEIPILHLSYGGWLQAVTAPPPHKNIELRCRQFQAAADPAFCLKLAKALVGGKIRNSRLLLRRNGRRLPPEALSQLVALRDLVERGTSLAELLGVEGSAAREYFRYFSTMFKLPPDDAPPFDFTGRNRRPPKDPINALLSFGYSLLVKEMVVAVLGVGFDPYLGFYHQPRYGRPALALDLMEEFRPLVADSVVITVINNGEIGPDDFLQRGEAVALLPRARKVFIEAFERRLDQLVTHPVFGYQVSYRRVFEIQARLLARTLTGEIPRYIPFVTR
ncbi:CRISPR-associated endonuclease Cas1 [Chloracidobacterium validum]|uniref:CRISPR-associated endonuclease Cas1 n=2 Tax=Chloracidobacterium validum TaxID=2821543 RepID=A0ABX8BGL0_9BACT|nr:CRISPR-associated endonuclease Cas1 [Chloracidobacterium validum]